MTPPDGRIRIHGRAIVWSHDHIVRPDPYADSPFGTFGTPPLAYLDILLEFVQLFQPIGAPEPEDRPVPQTAQPLGPCVRAFFGGITAAAGMVDGIFLMCEPSHRRV